MFLSKFPIMYLIVVHYAIRLSGGFWLGMEKDDNILLLFYIIKSLFDIETKYITTWKRRIQ